MPRIGLEQIPEPAGPSRQPDPMLSRALRQLVASLPENWRALVVLKYQEEMETEEIARALDMPVGTVKSQLSRALDFLREKASRVLGETEGADWTMRFGKRCAARSRPTGSPNGSWPGFRRRRNQLAFGPAGWPGSGGHVCAGPRRWLGWHWLWGLWSTSGRGRRRENGPRIK